MKKFYSFLVAAAMVLGATSCANNDTTEEILPAEGAISFVGELAASRTELGEGNKVMWNADDKIRIYTQENTAGASFAGAATEATPTTTFTTTEAFATSNTGYFAVYSDKPYYELDMKSWDFNWVAKEASYNNGVWSVPVRMQSEQGESLMLPANTFVEENNFMVAYSEDNKLSFKAATAIIKFVHTGVETWGSFRATGANLAGEATLNYDTATGEISYTTEGTETYIDFEVTEAGQTCYLPVYPGTVSGFELYDHQTLIAKYDGEFTFKAGVIYNMDIENMPALPVVSPYSVKVCSEGYAAGESYDMEVVDSFHVAKNVPNNPTGYGIFSTDSESPWYVSYSVAAADNVALNAWTSVGEYMGYNINFECEMVDIYFSPDNMMMCIVEAGATVPEMPKPFVPEVTTWAICGDLNSWGDTFMYTTETENLYVVKNVTMEAYSKFKVRKDSNWTTNYGGNFMYFEANKYMSVWKDGQDMLITTAGTYDIYFKYISSNEGKLYVVTAGEDYTTAVEQIAEGPQPNPTNVVFGLCGAHNNWGANDTEMALDATLNAYVAKNAKLTGEFKVRGNKTWGAYNYGAASNGTVTVGKGIQVSNGSNTNLKVTSGTYDVYFSYNKNMVWVMKVGEVPADL